MKKRKICLVVPGLEPGQARLQPWKYLLETARGLSRAGHDVTVLTSGPVQGQHVQERADGLEVGRIRLLILTPDSIRPSAHLAAVLSGLAPDVVLWHVGLSTFLHRFDAAANGIPSLGVLTSPIYQRKEFLRAGLFRLLRNPSLSVIHLAASLVPPSMYRHAIGNSGLQAIVTETHTNAQRLADLNLWNGPSHTIFPGVDRLWCEDHGAAGRSLRASLGYGGEDQVILFMGSPAPLRGLPVLTRAFRKALPENRSLRLIVLSRQIGVQHRRRPGSMDAEQPDRAVRVVRRDLDPVEVARYVTASDLVALPFVLVPSDAPLSLLEARAAGKPLVTTRISCLPELAGHESSFFAEPGDARSLTAAMLQAAMTHSDPRPPPFRRTWEQVGVEWSHLISGL